MCRFTFVAEAEDNPPPPLASPRAAVRCDATLVCPFGRPACRLYLGGSRVGWLQAIQPANPPGKPGRAGILPGRAPASAGRGGDSAILDMECLP
jgi:hypothetical protein